MWDLAYYNSNVDREMAVMGRQTSIWEGEHAGTWRKDQHRDMD
jgi:hypothetical protein